MLIDIILQKNLNNSSEVKKNTISTFLNPYSYLIARKNTNLFSKFDRVMIDGVSLVVLLRLFFSDEFNRTSFDMTSLASVVFKKGEEASQTFYFIGGEEGVAENALDNLIVKFPKLKVIGARHGFFCDLKDRSDAINNIVDLMPDIVVVGMGTPYQEEFLINLRDAGWNRTGYTCGGFFHQTAKSGFEYYPKWIDRFNLRWLYRIYDEPKLITRYFIYYPYSIILIFYDVIKYKLTSKNI